MIGGMFEQDLVAYIVFGLILNFLFSLLFGIYLSNNIGIKEMIETKGDKEQSMMIRISFLIPYAKMVITLYRVTILQLYFLNKGLSHKEFWVYMTNERNSN
ncbi:hypothetical protein GJV85_05455 [Sulfurimonas aquatica]|uniref:Uncharacterized protein n=1 Tax=Sulfurimonas aquatica TaxID=2672570 RepID=A0A975GCS2_9BACT|nr:hypothetical protein [Sulfurimonas aquatica]QSZ41574.1 hypothetical protein GJV85_05455 [Sulfurimonas aquatica]